MIRFFEHDQFRFVGPAKRALEQFEKARVFRRAFVCFCVRYVSERTRDEAREFPVFFVVVRVLGANIATSCCHELTARASATR